MTALIAAATHSVPVIVRSMPPEVVKSLPPVGISHMPPPDLGSVLLSVAGIVIALAALVVASITLQRVNRQIGIATEELDAVKKDFKLSQEQFDLAQRQFQLVARTPDLIAQLSVGNEVRQLAPDRAVYREVHVSGWVVNQGTKVSRGAVGDIYVPHSALFRPNGGSTVEIDGVVYLIWPILFGTLGRRVYPAKPMGVGRALDLNPEMGTITVLWRFDDEEYCYPERGYGEITLNFTLPI
jgi:hypothetical protein